MKRLTRKLGSKYKTLLGLTGIMILLGLLFSYAMFQGGFVSWFLFYSMLPFVAYTITMVFYPLHKIEITRTLNKDLMMAGEELVVTIELKRKTLFPLFYLIIHDEIPAPLYNEALHDGEEDQIHSRVLFFPLFKKKLVYLYRIKPVPRGIFELNSISLRTGDVFGFVQKEIKVHLSDRVFIYPRYQEIEHLEMDKHLQNGVQKSGRNSMTDYTSSVSVRDYVQGDRLSWLHWKASARSNKLVTKVFEHQRNNDYVIVLDQSVPSYKNNHSLFEKAVSFTASITHYSVQKGASLGLHSSRSKQRVPMNTGTDHEWRIFHELAGIQPRLQEPFYEWLRREFKEGRLESRTVVVISPLLDDVMMKTLELVSARQANVIFFYMSPNDRLHPQELTYIHRLNNGLIPTTAIYGPYFNEALKAGANRASI
ncbi:DUF58 domain-containing protein [Fictibacillus enclensis]|uniref:DUF58 domain-containing protein n=1 Tax=Fictibacillus enclensis TaxID=1017270 RepID=UPI0025A1B1C6|nr:DUF58 domain-containing protein [Fictibacillus enclensis]MDM5336230.1 DUF58 domain-containing protein [Fictibacillus enclensis]